MADRALVVNRWLIAAFGVTSGLYNVFGGQADLEIFGRLGLSPASIAAFGALQAFCGVALIAPRWRSVASLLLAGCNAFASYALFAAGVRPFGVISLLFVAMAVLAGRAPAAARPTAAGVGS